MYMFFGASFLLQEPGVEKSCIEFPIGWHTVLCNFLLFHFIGIQAFRKLISGITKGVLFQHHID